MKKNYLILFLFVITVKSFSQTPSLLPGYPLVLDSTQGTYDGGASPIIADFNNDGQKEILVCVNLKLFVGSVYLLKSDGSIMPNFPKQVSCDISYMNSAAGDVDGDGHIDIIVKAGFIVCI